MNDFERRLERATQRISPTYFQLPVYGQEDPVYRERCYCYELYHQLRTEWPNSGYFLSGEVDKSGHRVIRKNGLDRTKPDFLVHIPESMDNFAVIEVKPITGSKAGVEKDIATLLAYLTHANYQRAFYLIYGHAKDGKVLEQAQSHIREQKLEGHIELWSHEAPECPARRIEIYNTGTGL